MPHIPVWNNRYDLFFWTSVCCLWFGITFFVDFLPGHFFCDSLHFAMLKIVRYPPHLNHDVNDVNLLSYDMSKADFVVIVSLCVLLPD